MENVIETVGVENTADVIEAVDIAFYEMKIGRTALGDDLVHIPGEQIIHDNDVVLRVLRQFQGQVASDEPGSAGDQYTCHAM